MNEYIYTTKQKILITILFVGMIFTSCYIFVSDLNLPIMVKSLNNDQCVYGLEYVDGKENKINCSTFKEKYTRYDVGYK